MPDSDLLSAFVFLDAATLSCMLVCVVLSQQQQLLYPSPSPDPSPNPRRCVVVSQQLLYRLSDGSCEAIQP